MYRDNVRRRLMMLIVLDSLTKLLQFAVRVSSVSLIAVELILLCWTFCCSWIPPVWLRGMTCACATPEEGVSQASTPSSHVCSNAASPVAPHFLNQLPPRAQHVDLPALLVTHLAHVVVASVVFVVAIAAAVNTWELVLFIHTRETKSTCVTLQAELLYWIRCERTFAFADLETFVPCVLKLWVAYFAAIPLPASSRSATRGCPALVRGALWTFRRCRCSGCARSSNCHNRWCGKCTYVRDLQEQWMQHLPSDNNSYSHQTHPMFTLAFAGLEALIPCVLNFRVACCSTLLEPTTSGGATRGLASLIGNALGTCKTGGRSWCYNRCASNK